MAGGESYIVQAIGQLGRSLDKAEEASLHATAAAKHMDFMSVSYRLAMGGADLPDDRDFRKLSEEASGKVTVALSAIRSARVSIRDYSARIASHSRSLLDSDLVRESPSGDELIVISKRPRSIKEVGTQGVRSSPDAGDIGNLAVSDFQAFRLKAPTPPEVTGATANVNPQPEHSVSSPPAGPHDATGNVVIATAILFQGAVLAADRLVKAARKSISSTRSEDS